VGGHWIWASGALVILVLSVWEAVGGELIGPRSLSPVNPFLPAGLGTTRQAILQN